MADTCAAPSGEKPFSFGLSPTTLAFIVVPILAILPFISLIGIPWFFGHVGRALGWYLGRKNKGRREQLVQLMEAADEKYGQNEDNDGWEAIESHGLGSAKNGAAADKEWSGTIGFLHPFSNAGGGGERVLWAAIKATQKRWPKAKIFVYTGDHDVAKDAMLARVESRFNIRLYPPTITFLYLTSRHYVLASTWPRFTLLGQSLGSIWMAYDALQLLVPDIFVDTMGYAFALAFCKLLFKDIPTCAYVHYPTISTDMLESLNPKSAVGSQGVNAGQGTGARGFAKRVYWNLFAMIYALVGATIDRVMTNSTWTHSHITKLWGPHRWDNPRVAGDPMEVVYPPVAVRELEEQIDVSEASEAKREKVLLYIAQFRPEKNHQLILEAFAEFVKKGSKVAKEARLVLIGSVRDDKDSKRVLMLRLLAHELGIREQTEFHTDLPWPEVEKWLAKASVGVNGMWNEHFGIGVVEYQAAGLISVVHDSGGPKLDIVTAVDGEPTGFLATTATEFAEAFEQALSLPNPIAWRLRARKSAQRFTEEVFARRWKDQMELLVRAAKQR